MPAERFAVGDTMIRRDVWFKKVWSALPWRVVHDDGVSMTAAMWPGSSGYAPEHWVSWLETGDTAIRERVFPDLVSGRWNLSPWAWRSTIVLRQVVRDRWFAVSAFFDAENHTFRRWYVDFERPPIRTRYGIDTRDLFLDLVIEPDYSWHWKDEHEFAEAISVGLLTADDVECVKQARQQVLALIECRELLRGRWQDWRLDESWQAPTASSEAATYVDSDSEISGGR